MCQLENQESCGMIQLGSKRLRIWSFEVEGQEKMGVPAEEEREVTYPSSFCSLWALHGLGDTDVGQGWSVYSVY